MFKKFGVSMYVCIYEISMYFYFILAALNWSSNSENCLNVIKDMLYQINAALLNLIFTW